MSISARLNAAGLPWQQTRAIIGDVDASVTAAGNSQGTAYVIVSPITVCSTVAASTGVVLPASMIGDELRVYNGGANALSVYPPSGGSINGGTLNAASSLAVKTLLRLTCISTNGLNFATG